MGPFEGTPGGVSETMNIIDVLIDEGFQESKKKPGLFSRDYDDITVYADMRKGKLRFYGFDGGNSVPGSEIDRRVSRVKQRISAIGSRTLTDFGVR